MKTPCKCNIWYTLSKDLVKFSKVYNIYMLDLLPISYCFNCGGLVSAEYKGIKVWIETYCVLSKARFFLSAREFTDLYPPEQDNYGTMTVESPLDFGEKYRINKGKFTLNDKNEYLYKYLVWRNTFKYINLHLYADFDSDKIVRVETERKRYMVSSLTLISPSEHKEDKK